MSNLKLKKNNSELDENKDSLLDKNNLNKYFYKVSNHHELFKIGESFYDDFEHKKIKSFAISSTGYQDSQQKSILGLASFFDHRKKDIKICIVSDNLFHGVFKELIMASILSEVVIDENIPSINIYRFHSHFEFVDLEQVIHHVNDKKVSDYDEVLDKLIAKYDVIFWDVPELHKIQDSSEKYFPVIMKFESLSIIISKKISSAKDIDEIKEFFVGYGINLKGLLLENVMEGKKGSDLSKMSKTPWWRLF